MFSEKISHAAEIKHDGAVHRIHLTGLEIAKCKACGELIFGDRADEQMSEALRAHLHLLTPAQICTGRSALSLGQQELADRLGIAEATFSAWENGALIQSRAMDNLLRIFFTFPEVRSAMRDGSLHPATR